MRTRDPDYRALARFWTRIFAVNFVVGVSTGVVMEFQFGTNWGRFSRFAGDVFGSALAAEGIFAFFLESGFLAILVYGWDRVGPRLHFFSTCMVALGSTFSAIWIVVANSLMNTPAGHHVVLHDGVPRAEIVDFWGMVFSPSSVHRLVHVLLGAYMLGAFFVLSVSAWHLLHRRHEAPSRKAFTIALWVAAAAVAAMFVSGDRQARKVAFTQPAKLAAFEGLFHTTPGGTPMTLVGWPNVREQRMDFQIAVPGLLSLLVSGDPKAPVKGLDQFPVEDRPPVAVPFATYHAMVYIWGGLALLTALGVVLQLTGRLFASRRLLWAFVFAVIGPYVANQAGWVACEVGRQPWVVYGLLRTSEGDSHSVPAGQITASFVMLSVVYFLLFVVWVRLLDRLIRRGPEPAETPPPATSPEDALDVAARRTGGGVDAIVEP
ncbi:MAG TPA: cytochrome ubiquinol oxidase subunit I [Isosphaeraceae bacterium]